LGKHFPAEDAVLQIFDLELIIIKDTEEAKLLINAEAL
jgi:hypothetical protein